MPTKASPDPERDEIKLEDALKKLEEFSQRLAQFEKADEEKAKLIQAQAAEIRSLKAAGEGWLITTPSSTFNGSVFGVQFVNGLGFVPKGRVFPEFAFKPMGDETRERYLEQFKTPEKRKKAEEDLKKAEARTTAEIAVHQMRYDRGFKVEWIGLDDQETLKERQAARAREAAIEQEQINTALTEQMSKLLNPPVLAR